LKIRGFVFSLEACIALIIFGLTCITLFQPTQVSLKELIVLQQENDLLKVWSVTYPTQLDSVKDCEQLFGDRFELKIDGILIHSFRENANSVSSSAILLDDSLSEKLFELTVYFEVAETTV
jgi:hypothetical protein